MKKDYCVVSALKKLHPDKDFTCFDNDTSKVVCDGKPFEVTSVSELDIAGEPGEPVKSRLDIIEERLDKLISDLGGLS